MFDRIPNEFLFISFVCLFSSSFSSSFRSFCRSFDYFVGGRLLRLLAIGRCPAHQTGPKYIYFIFKTATNYLLDSTDSSRISESVHKFYRSLKIIELEEISIDLCRSIGLVTQRGDKCKERIAM